MRAAAPLARQRWNYQRYTLTIILVLPPYLCLSMIALYIVESLVNFFLRKIFLSEFLVFYSEAPLRSCSLVSKSKPLVLNLVDECVSLQG